MESKLIEMLLAESRDREVLLEILARIAAIEAEVAVLKAAAPVP